MRSIGAYNITCFTKRILFCTKEYLIIFVFLLTLLPALNSFTQEYPAYEELALFLDVPNLGGRDMDILILEDEVYLPITDLFDFLKIRNIPSAGLDTISGFFINQEATFLVDKNKNEIQFGGELFELNPGDLIRTETNLYLRGIYYGLIFGLESDFNFRTMSVRINTQLELPAIREMRQEAMRKNMNRLVGEIEADTLIGRSYPIFHFGMADWSANVTEQLNGPVNARLGLALGSIIAGGEATVILNYNTYSAFTEKQQYYLWRYVNNNNKAVRQVMAGKIATGATSSIFDPVVGAKITNASTQFRRSFGTYTLSDRTEPEWIVELYVNNVLVDYTTADASGFFTFEVPLVYGNTNVRLKFYGPYGEERVREQNITIPFNFVPKKTLEYSVSAGMVEDNFQSKFSRARVDYGLTRSITLGTGVEYLSSVTSAQVMPFVNGSFRLASNLLLSGEYSPEVRSMGTLTYRLPSSLQFDIKYIYYKKGQTAIKNIFREERRFSMSMPIRFNNFSVYNRLSVNQLVLPSTNYTTSEWLISGALFGVSTNITTYGVFIGNTKPYFYSDLSLSFRLPRNISIQPRAQYSYTNNEFLSAKVLVEKRVFKKGYLTASYEQNFRSNMHLVEFGFRYDFKFAQTSISSRTTNRATTFIQYARGSIVNDSKNNYVYTDNRGNVGKGAISIIPFLDKNANGTRDPGEPKVAGLNLRANAGRIEKRTVDTTIRIFGLEPYTDCFIEFEQSSIDNIAWRLNNRTMNIAVDPNMVKLVEIPISVVGEAAGMVRIDKKGDVRGLARIIVNFYDKDQKKIGRTLSEEDGYFGYFGFKPGNYAAILDTAQLLKLGMVSSPQMVNFNIAANIDGDYIDGLDFIVKLDTLKQIKELKTIDMILNEEVEQDMETALDSYIIEIGAFENKTEADTLRSQLSVLLGKEVNLIIEDDIYKLRVIGLQSRTEVEETFPVLQSKGINEIGLITIKGMLSPAQTGNISAIESIQAETISAVVIAHEIIEEDITSSTDSYAIEIGDIETEAEAAALQDQLSTILGKEVSSFKEDNQYKVRITGLMTIDEVKETMPVLKIAGISEIGLITVKGVFQPTSNKNIPGIETIPNETGAPVVITHEKIIGDTTSSIATYAIEIGAFENENEAVELQGRLSTILGKEVSIFKEDNLYKISISGLMTKDEVKETFPVLQSQGISEIGLITFKTMIKPKLYTIALGSEVDIVKSISENDTTVLVVHKKMKEDTISSAESYAIEIGTFENETEAIELRDQLSKLLGKEVSLVKEDNIYKVLVSGLTTKDEVKETFPVLMSKGINEIGLITFKGMLNSATTINKHGIEGMPAKTFSAVVIAHEIIKEDITSSTDSYAIEVGAFKTESEAAALRDQLTTLLGKEVSLFPEDDLFKVRVTGVHSMVEVEETFPVLQSNGINVIGLITFKGMLSPEETVDIPSAEAFSDIVITFEKIKEDTTSSTNSYTIEVGTFKNESEALVLRDQLSTVLGKEVSLFPEDNLFKVRVTGLTAKDDVEETFPVLISNGINEIGLITFKGMLNPATVTDITGTETGQDEMLTKKPTAVIVVNEKIKEDTTSSTDNYTIEIGAFKTESEATALRDQFSVMLGKEISLFPEDDLYKVRVTGLNTRDEVEETFPTLLSNGINEIGLITFKGMLKPASTINISGLETGTVKTYFEKDSTGVIIHEIIEEDMTSSTDSYAIQLGAFKRKENATNLKKKLGSSLGKEVNITVEGEFNKVRITGFKSSYEVERYIPTLVKQGIREIWVVTLKGTLKPDLVAGEPDIHREVLNTLTEKDTTYLIVHDVFEEVITTGPESYAIQLGAFNRKINADALRIRLATILGRDVKIFVEDELYNVRIIGFKTQDEANKYIPVLQINGISDIKVLKLKGRQNYRTAISRLDTISGTKDKVSRKSSDSSENRMIIEDIKESTPDNVLIINETITPVNKKEEILMIPEKEKATEKTKVKETSAAVSNVAESKKKIDEVPYEVERKKSIDERLLVAEYRSGLYESRWPGVEFTIQIAASKSISDPEEIKKKFGLSGKVEVVKMGEWYRFTTGSYIKYWQAREYRNILRSRVGIDDAFVVAYKDGKRIMLTDLVAMTESTPEARTGITVRPEISKGFSVQILATKDGNLSVSDIRDKYEIDDDVYKEYNESDGLYRYSIGNFSTYTGAVKVRNKIRAKGFRDAFVVGYKDGKRVKDLKSIL